MLAFVRVPARTSRRGARYRDSFVPRPTPEFAAGSPLGLPHGKLLCGVLFLRRSS